jgi:uncharacterized OsmC-like protein
MATEKEYDVSTEFTDHGSFRSVVTRSADEDFATGMVREKHELRVDEPEWLEPPGAGKDAYPAPVDYMVFGLVACQLEVLYQALEKARVEDFEIEARAEVTEVGEDQPADEMLAHHAGRISHIDVDVSLTVPEEFEGRAQQCLNAYDTGCVVGQSFRQGIDYTPRTSLTVR